MILPRTYRAINRKVAMKIERPKDISLMPRGSMSQEGRPPSHRPKVSNTLNRVFMNKMNQFVSFVNVEKKLSVVSNAMPGYTIKETTYTYIRHTRRPSVNIKQYLVVAQNSEADFCDGLTATDRFYLSVPDEA